MFPSAQLTFKIVAPVGDSMIRLYCAVEATLSKLDAVQGIYQLSLLPSSCRVAGEGLRRSRRRFAA